MGLLILDRDGVINRDSPAFIKSREEWIALPGSLAAIANANQKGYRVVVVTNQSGLARGLFDIGALNAIHTHMLQTLAKQNGRIDAIFFCPHLPTDNCSCRKPKAGLLHELANRLKIDLRSAVFIGDRASDMAAAQSVGARAILVKTGHGEQTLKSNGTGSKLDVYDDLSAAVASLPAQA